MSRTFDFADVRQGDVLLYRPTGIFGKIISIKTWTHVSHVEVYAGGGTALASRDGKGVARYALRTEDLGYVLRPTKRLDWDAALEWFYNSADGQKYDWKGIMVFSLAVRQGAMDRMFCSEFACRFFDRGGHPLFAPGWDADRTPPSMLLATRELELVWQDGKPI